MSTLSSDRGAERRAARVLRRPALGRRQTSPLGRPRTSLLHRNRALRTAMRRLAGFNPLFSSG